MSEAAMHRVLVVDDDLFLAGMLQRMLKSAGVVDTLHAADGAAALESIASNPPALVLCDLNMPGMDGLEFVRHLAAISPTPALALMSGADRRVLNTARQLAQAHGLNVIGILSKPVAAHDLKDLLSRVVHPQHRGVAKAIASLSIEQVQQGIEAGHVRAHYQPKVRAHYQPKIRAQDGTLYGVEALLRWQDPVRGVVPPVAVIPVAESNGLMDSLTLAVFRAVLVDAPRLLAASPGLTIAINVSAENLQNLDFVEQVLSLIHQAGVDPGALMIEVTESRLIENITRPAEILTRLRLKGIGLSVDDYGTGASTLQQLQRIPATELKIDRVFVNGATHDPEALAMLESSVDLARRLGLVTVAEGVESEEEMEIVRRVGCDLVQGYYVQRPVSADALLDWISAL